MEHKLFKRLFSMCLVIAMVLSMCPTFVFAESTAEEKADPNYCPHCDTVLSADDWMAWDATAVAAGGHYRLTESFTQSAQITIAAGADTVIDLAGYTITGQYPTTTPTTNASTTRLFLVQGTLSVLDSTATTVEDVYTSGALYGGYINASTKKSAEAVGSWGPKGGNILVETGATFNLYGGAVKDGRVRGSGYQTQRLGGNIFGAPGSEINMYGGVVSGGQIVEGSYLHPDYYNGGCNIGSFGDVNIYGGTIKDGYLDNWTPTNNYKSNKMAGGNIYVIAGTGLDGELNALYIEKATVSGGYLKNDRETKADGNCTDYVYGGNIYANGVSVTIKDSTIADGKAHAIPQRTATHTGTNGAYACGGNIYVNGGNLTITGATTISGGEAIGQITVAEGVTTGTCTDTGYGGSIYIAGNSKYNLSIGEDVQILDGTATYNGGNIYASLTTIESWGTITGGTVVEYRGGNIYQDGCTMSVRGGLIANGTAPNRGGNYFTPGGTLNIYGGQIVGATEGATVAADDYSNGIVATAATVNIYGGTINSNKGTPAVFLLYSDLNVYGGTLLTNTTNVVNTYNSTSGGCEVTVYGGTLNGTVKISNGATKAATETTEEVIYWCRATQYGGYVKSYTVGSSNTSVVVYNGTLATDPADYAADCTCTYDNGDSTWTVWQPNVDETGLCATCGHTYDADTACSTCEAVHAPAGSTHPWGETTVVTEPTCTAVGESTHTCTVCGTVETMEIPMLDHSFVTYTADGNATCKEDGTKTAKCENCDQTHTVADEGSHLTVEHTYGDFVDGVQSCTVCGETNSCVHSYTDAVTDPTCTAQGYTTHTCSKCGDSYEDTYTDPVDHTYTEYISDGNATCTADGTKTAVCDTCGVAEETIADEGSMLEHNYGEYDENGVKTCVDCSATYTCPHTESELKNGSAATCLAAGYTGDYVCTECGVTTQEGSAIEQLAHSYGEDNICVNGCEALAGAVVTYPNGDVEKYTDLMDALKAADGNNATVDVLKNHSTDWHAVFGSSDTTLNDVTIAIPSGVTVTDSDDSSLTGSNEKVYLKNIIFKGEGKFTVADGYPYFYGENHIEGTVAVTLYMSTIQNGEFYVHGEQGATLSVKRNFWVGSAATMIVTGLNDGTVVVDANTYRPSSTRYSTVIQGTLNITDAAMKCAGVNVETGTVNMVNATITSPDTFSSHTGEHTLWMEASSAKINMTNSHLTLAGTAAFAEGATISMCADSTITTTTADLENVSIVSSDATKHVVCTDGVYTATGEHTAADAVVENNVDATCGADGSYDTVVYCSVCNGEISRVTTTVPATGEHSYDAGVRTEATTTTNAYITYTCLVCSHSYTEEEEGTMLRYAVNETTGESYATVQDALNAASKGDTVKLLKDAEEEDLYVGDYKTLDLDGHTLTAGTVAASFANSFIIDNTNGEGLLVVDKENIALNESNKQLPLWYAEGARFVNVSYLQAISYKDKTGAANEDVAYYRFAFADLAAKTILDEFLANGTEGTGISVRIKATWTNANGTVTQYFTFTSELVEQYVVGGRGWDANMFKMYLSGVEDLSDLSFTAEIVSSANTEATVVIGSTAIS